VVTVIEDERGRIPFAVIAILLLVSSATVATTMAPATTPPEPSVDVVLDRIDAEQQTAIRRSVRAAATEAGRNPVIEPANTSAGRAIGEDHTFRDALRLRVYATARQKLAAIERTRGDVRASVRLPAVDPTEQASVRAAIERVELAPADPNGTALTVRIHNVTTSVRRHGRIVNERTHSPRVTVGTPILALHDRVSTYEDRLNAGLTSPGLEQRLAALLNAAGWTRGYAQYGGVPIGNVLSNDHVAVATNAALLDVQRATIGRADQDGVRRLERELGRLGAQEILALRSTSSPFLERALEDASLAAPNEIEGLDVPGRDEPRHIGVNTTASDAFLLMLREPKNLGGLLSYREERSLESVIEAAYTADVRLSTSVVRRSGSRPEPPSAPGSGWTQIDSSLSRSVTVQSAESELPGTATAPWHTLDRFSRTVVTTYDRTATWKKGGNFTRTGSASEAVDVVRVTLEGRHAPRAAGPDRPIANVHDARTGALNGPNLAGVEARAREALIVDQGGKDALARQAVRGSIEATRVSITGKRPEGIREWIYRDLRSLCRETANVTIAVDPRDLGSFGVNPGARLEAKLREREHAFVQVGERYDGVADRARVAARSTYLDLVIDGLERRAANREARKRALSGALDEADAGTVDDVQRSVHAAVEDPLERQPELQGPGGAVGLRVDAAPTYLSLTTVDANTVPAVDGETRPLVARNLNLFSLPYGEAIDGFLGSILSGPDRTNLASAAQTLERAQTYDVDAETSVGGVRVSLDQVVAAKVDHLRDTAASILERRGVGESDSERAHIVAAGLTTWDDTAARAIAFSNGSATTAILAAADEHAALNDVDRDRLGLELDRGVRLALETADARPQSRLVQTAHEAVKSEASGAIRSAANDYADKTVEKVTGGRYSTLPSGLPLAPVPGYWYATTNVWHVDVRGEYARFGVRSSRGRPANPGAGLAYTRDGSNVTRDLDGDGDPERLGTARPVQFSATVDVVVVVPPAPRGVGDTAGQRDERSPGWPTPAE